MTPKENPVGKIKGKPTLWKSPWLHLLVLAGFVALSFFYASPTLSGKRLFQTDIAQSVAGARELVAYREKTGEWSTWTNSMFGGMPAFMIASEYPNSISTKIGRAVTNSLPGPVNILFIGLACAYLLLVVVTGSIPVSIVGAIGFSFATFNLVSIEAGHVSKVLAIAYAPGVLAGVLIAFRKNWLVGSALTGLLLALELYTNHVQITYYLALMVFALVIVESTRLIKQKQTKKLAYTLAGLGLSAVLAIGTETTRLWNTLDYSKETIRGKSELTTKLSPEQDPGKDGLDKAYAFNWSYGIGESLTFLIPNAFGGASGGGSLGNNSATYKVLVGRGIDPASASGFVQNLPLPLYWGSQPSTGGPVYMGAIIFFLFVLGLFVVKDSLKWWALGFVLLFTIWAWGKNFAAINYAFFDYFPMLNKFRAVTMTLAFAQLSMVIIAAMALAAILAKKISWNVLQKPLLISLGITGGLALLLGLMPSLFFSFRGPNDAVFLENMIRSTKDRSFAEQIIRAVGDDRASMLRMDAFRSVFFILVAVALIWAWMKNKINQAVLVTGLAFLMIFDLFGVGKRYLNNADFVNKSLLERPFTPSAADEEILRDPDPNYRVLDLTNSPMSSAEASYFHKSLGGYHAAKLRRYQEFFEKQAGRPGGNQALMDLLNAKYILVRDSLGNPRAQTNPGALGHAWFINTVKVVPNADAELAALDSLKPADEAIIDQRFAETLKGLSIVPAEGNSIKLTSYKPNELVYETNATGEQLAVFSEIYYNVRDEWKVTIDDKPAQMIRADYILRALRIPAGKHHVVFRFDPISVSAGGKIDLVFSILFSLLLVGGAYVSVVDYRKRQKLNASA